MVLSFFEFLYHAKPQRRKKDTDKITQDLRVQLFPLQNLRKSAKSADDFPLRLCVRSE
jgi:hypothetical protein